MNSYKIGKISKTLGVSTHLLKHYEDFSLLKSQQDTTTKYRYYDFQQCGKVIESRKIRNIGIPVKDIAKIANNYSNDEYNVMLENQVKHLEAEILKIQNKISKAKLLQQESETCDKFLNQWIVDIIPAKYILLHSNKNQLLKDSTSIVGGVNLLEYMPYCKSVMKISKETLYENEVDYNWGLCVDEAFINDTKLPLDDKFIKIPQTKAYITYLKLGLPYCENNLIFNEIKNILNKSGFTPTGDIIAQNVKSACENQIVHRYFKIIIPI